MRPGPQTLAPVSTAAAWCLHQEPLSLLGLATAAGRNPWRRSGRLRLR